MTVKIKAIDINAFRGIPSLGLDLERKSILIRGENGTGKSSIVDAIEYFFRGTLSIFEGEGTQSLSESRHAPHKNYKTDDIKISLTFDPGGISLTRTYNKFSNVPASLKDYVQATENGTFILRRSQILKFIYCRASDRYNEIATILGIEHLDEIELSLKSLWDKLSEEAKEKEKHLQELKEAISTLLSKKISNDNDIIEATNEFLKANQFKEIKSLSEIVELHGTIVDTLTKTIELGQLSTINKTQMALEILEVDENLVEDYKTLFEKVESLLKGKGKIIDIARKELLLQGENVITLEDANICPLCEQEINRESLLQKIETRLKTLESLSEEATEIRKSGVAIQEKLRSRKSDITSIHNNIESLPKLQEEAAKLTKLELLIENIIKEIEDAIDLKTNVKFGNLQEAQSYLRKCRESLCQQCKRLLEEGKVPDNIRKILDSISCLALLKDKTDDLTRTRNEIQVSEKRIDLSRKMFNAFSEAKKDKITDICSTISSDLDTFYSKLHPDDPHKDVTLNVIPSRRASAELKIKSFGREGEDPRALTSEGHQDSLGLCMFLAFVKNFNKDSNLVVLDDVVTTIDAQHREMICDLLFDVFKEYQLIITTHDEVWYDQLCNYQRVFDVHGNFKNLVITKWDSENGPIIEPYKPRWERIQEKLQSSDKIGAGIEGRLYIEWLLKNICYETKAAVPFEFSGKYTVSQLLEPAKKRLMELVKDADYGKNVEKGFKALECRAIMINLMAHDSPMLESVSIDEVKRFCNSVNELKKIVSCPSCESLLRYYQDMKKLRCPNSKCNKPLEVVC